VRINCSRLDVNWKPRYWLGLTCASLYNITLYNTSDVNKARTLQIAEGQGNDELVISELVISESVNIMQRLTIEKWSNKSCFYRAKPSGVRYFQGKLSVRPSVWLSVTLRYCGHIGWNSWKIISRLISLTFSLSADPNMTDLLQREHPQILAGIGVG